MSLPFKEVVRGSKPGSHYIRYQHQPMFRYLTDGHLVARPELLKPTTPVERALAGLRRLCVGDPLPTERAIHERLTKVKGLAVLSSDALSSVAYAVPTGAPEAPWRRVEFTARLANNVSSRHMAAADRGIERDRDLAARAGAGDTGALSTLFERHFDELYDFALRLTRDADLAAGAVQTTFTKCWDELRSGRAPANLRAWLFATARTTAIDDVRRLASAMAESTHTIAAAAPDFRRFDAGRASPHLPLEQDDEAIRLTWTAVAGLGPAEHGLLDMHLRQGLSPPDIAAACGSRRSRVESELHDFEQALDDAVGFTLLLRRGRDRCAGLDALLGGADAQYVDAVIRRLMDHHLATCQVCPETLHGYPRATELFAAFAPVPAPSGARDAAWRQLVQYVERAGLMSHRARPLLLKGLPLGRLGAAAAAVLAVALLGGRALLSHGPAPDPVNVHSTDHVVGQASADRSIAVSWEAQPNAQAYAVLWSRDPRDAPSAHESLAGTATGTTSPPLSEGVWYFHLRVQDRDGQWSDAIHLGPFIIAPPTATATPPPPQPTATSAPQPAPTTPPPPPAAASGRPAASPARSSAGPSRPSPTPTARRIATATPKPPTATPPPPTATPRPPTSVPPAPAPSGAPAPAAAIAAPTPAPSGAGCPTALSGASLSAAPLSVGNRVALSWTSNGGCPPYRGTISARFEQDATPYITYPLNQPSGTVIDTVQIRCGGTFTVAYALSLADAANQTASASATARISFAC